MRNTTQGAALLAALAFSGLVATGAAAQGYDRYNDRSYGASARERQQERYYGSYGDYYVQDQYERGYRMGRDDERRARDQDARRGYGTASQLLDEARREIDNGNLRDAWITLGHAETNILNRAATRGDQAAAEGAIGAIRDARRAVQDREAWLARDRIQRAETLVERGRLVGARVSGEELAGAGVPGPAGPMAGGQR